MGRRCLRAGRGALTTVGRRCLRAGPAVLSLTVVVLGAATPGYRDGSETISSLAAPGRPWAAVAAAGMVAYGLLVAAGAPATTGATMRGGRALAALVGAYGAAGAVTGLAAKPLPGSPTTAAGTVHVVVALLGGAAVTAAMAVVWRWGATCRSRRTAGVLAIAVPAVSVAFALAWGTGVYGWLERALVAMPALWVPSLAAIQPPVP